MTTYAKYTIAMTFRICFTFGLLTVIYNWWACFWKRWVKLLLCCASLRGLHRRCVALASRQRPPCYQAGC